MLVINGVPAEADAAAGEGAFEIAEMMASGGGTYYYGSKDELIFELKLRRAIVDAAGELGRSGLQFRTFRNSFCSDNYWRRGNDGGFALRRGSRPNGAIRDIYKNGRKYGTECATAMEIVYYGALLEVFSERTFNSAFKNIYLMNWHDIDPLLSETGLLLPARDFFPGDRRYFKNPDVDPKTPEWQGENVIDMGDGTYYGHGIGRHNAEYIINALNRNRKRGSNTSAYLMPLAGRPDFNKLYAASRA